MSYVLNCTEATALSDLANAALGSTAFMTSPSILLNRVVNQPWPQAHQPVTAYYPLLPNDVLYHPG